MSKSFTSSRLLILAGSDEVAPYAGRLTALDHFDGAAFRMVRQHLGESPAIVADGLHILVLTAAGFVGAYERVSSDMAPIGDDQADELAADKRSAKVLHDALDGADRVFILCSNAIEESLGALMMGRTAGAVDWMRSEVARGSDGRKLNGLLRWLVRTTPGAEERADMIRAAAMGVECATDHPLSDRAQAVLESYMAELEGSRDELSARRALAGVN
jgi:hypothetical protein